MLLYVPYLYISSGEGRAVYRHYYTHIQRYTKQLEEEKKRGTYILSHIIYHFSFLVHENPNNKVDKQ